MKKILWFVVLIYGLCVPTSFAKEIKSEKVGEWSVLRYTQALFPTEYANHPCYVYVRKDSNEIQLTATDLDWGGSSLRQKVTISNDGAVFRKSVSYAELPKDSRPLMAHKKKKDQKEPHDVFAKYCAKAARGLPVEVKNLFGGHYGLGK